MTLVTLEFPFRAHLEKHWDDGRSTPGNLGGWSLTQSYERQDRLRLHLSCIVKDEPFVLPECNEIDHLSLVPGQAIPAPFKREMMRELARAFPKLRGLTLSGWSVDSALLEELKPLNLRSLHIGDPKVREDSFWDFVAKNSMEFLAIQGEMIVQEPHTNLVKYFRWDRAKASLESCTKMGESMPNLERLEMHWTDETLSVAHLDALLGGTKKIRGVSIRDEDPRSNQRRLATEDLLELAQKHKLKWLRYTPFDSEGDYRKTVRIEDGVQVPNPAPIHGNEESDE